MAIIGRKACPDCDFPSAHIKQNAGKLPYRHCPQCGMMTPAKNLHQAELLKRGMRPEGQPEPPAAADPIAIPAADAKALTAPHVAPSTTPVAPAEPPRRAGLWDQLMSKSK